MSKTKTIQIGEEEIKLFEDALQCQYDSNMESDHDMLTEAITDSDWEFAQSIIYKFAITDRAFKVLRTLKAVK